MSGIIITVCGSNPRSMDKDFGDYEYKQSEIQHCDCSSTTHSNVAGTYVLYACVYACVYVCMHACMHACTGMYACMYLCMHVCMYACTIIVCI